MIEGKEEKINACVSAADVTTSLTSYLNNYEYIKCLESVAALE